MRLLKYVFRSIKLKIFLFVLFTVLLMCTVFAFTIYNMQLNSSMVRASSYFHNAFTVLNRLIIKKQNDIKNSSDLLSSSPILTSLSLENDTDRREAAKYLEESADLGGLGIAAIFDGNGRPVVFAFNDDDTYYSGYESLAGHTVLMLDGDNVPNAGNSAFINEFLIHTHFSEDGFIFSELSGQLAVEYFQERRSDRGVFRLMTATVLNRGFLRQVSDVGGMTFLYFINGQSVFSTAVQAPGKVGLLFPMSYTDPKSIIRKDGKNIMYQRWVIKDGLTVDFAFYTTDFFSSDISRNIAMGFLMMLLFVFLAVVPISFFILHRMVSRPLKELGQAVKNIESVDYKTLITIERDDEIGELVGLYNDMIKLIKKREIELEEINDQLEQMVKQETGKRLKNEQLLFEQQKFVDMGQMVNAIAHQWRQPLNIIGLSVQSFVINYRENRLSGTEAEEFENKIMSMLMHMSSTIDDFRNFFRTDKTIKTFPMVVNVTEVIRLISAQMKYNGIALRFRCRCSDSFYEYSEITAEKPECECTSSLVSGFPGELKQAVLNLVQNSKDAILARIARQEIEEGVLDIYMESDGTNISLKVTDNGGGIDNSIIGRIFDPYFTTKSEEHGTGIGLYMTKSIIEKHMNGKITAENTGDGAVFTLILPLAKDGDFNL